MSDRNGVTEMSNPQPLIPNPYVATLWIDGVGGYLLCLSHRVTLGQSLSESPVDIALIADVSRNVFFYIVDVCITLLPVDLLQHSSIQGVNILIRWTQSVRTKCT